MRTILAPTDFSDAALAGVRTAAILAGHLDASVVLVHVFDPEDLMPAAPVAWSSLAYEEMIERLRKTAVQRLQETRGEFPEGVEVSIELLHHGSAAQAITQHAADIGADLIVMSTHGRTGFKRFLLGSITEKTVRLASCPVLAVPPTRE